MTTKTTKSKRVVKSKDIKIPIPLMYATPISAAFLWMVHKNTDDGFSWVMAGISVLLYLATIFMVSIHNKWITFEYKAKKKTKISE